MNLKLTSCLLYSFLSLFFLTSWLLMCHFSPKWHSLQSIQAQSQMCSPSPSASCVSLTFTHKHTPLVGISATLLTGANQSYNTFIISTPPQVPSCWVKSHLGLFECFTALEICNYIMDMGGTGLAGSSHWQLDTKQTRCEQNSTPQKKKNKMRKRTKTTVYDQCLAVVTLHSFLGPSLFNLHKLQNGKLAHGSKRSHFKLGGKTVEFQGFQKNKYVKFPNSYCCLKKECGFCAMFKSISIKKDSRFTQFPYFGSL